MPTYIIPFKKTIYGYFKGEAENLEEAAWGYRDFPEYPNTKVEYEVDEKFISEVK